MKQTNKENKNEKNRKEMYQTAILFEGEKKKKWNSCVRVSTGGNPAASSLFIIHSSPNMKIDGH